jgi:two-component system response regulator ResD
MLPDISGIEVCKQVRKFSNIPIIMLTAKSEDVDKIVGLEIGADDYITKPFNPKELIARVKAVLRRAIPAEIKDLLKESSEKITIAFTSIEKPGLLKENAYKDKSQNKGISQKNKNISFLEIIPQSMRVFINGNEVKLTNKEYSMLVYFIENKDIVISREKLLENIWGYDFIGESRTIDVHIKELRKKINDNHGKLIETIWSVGYRFNYDSELNKGA